MRRKQLHQKVDAVNKCLFGCNFVAVRGERPAIGTQAQRKSAAMDNRGLRVKTASAARQNA
jgi:hypothetical protein